MICSTEQALGWTAVLGGREVGETCEVRVEGDTKITLKGRNHSSVEDSRSLDRCAGRGRLVLCRAEQPGLGAGRGGER